MKILILEGLYGNNKGKEMQWRLKRTNLKVGDKVVLDCKDWKIVKVIGEKKKSFNKMCEEEHKKMMKKLMADPLIKKIIKEGKEVKEMKYLEVKVVKVKKKEQREKCVGSAVIDGKTYTIYMGKNDRLHYRTEKPKGNWVNGENLDKIKFPVPCSYVEEGKKHIGMLNCYVDKYILYNIEKQSKDNFIDDCTSLGNLIGSYNIHILKGKIIIFEEE